MNASLTRRAFEEAGLDGIPALLAEVRAEIERRLARVVEAAYRGRDQVRLFHATCDEIVSELNKLGHRLYSLDVDSDSQDLVFDQQLWGADYWDRRPRGLDLELKPFRCRVRWGDRGRRAERIQGRVT